MRAGAGRIIYFICSDICGVLLSGIPLRSPCPLLQLQSPHGPALFAFKYSSKQNELQGGMAMETVNFKALL